MEPTPGGAEATPIGPPHRSRGNRRWWVLGGLVVGPALLWLVGLAALSLAPVQRELLRRGGLVPSGAAISWQRATGWPGGALTLHGVSARGPGWHWQSQKITLAPDWKALLHQQNLDLRAARIGPSELELILGQWPQPAAAPTLPGGDGGTGATGGMGGEVESVPGSVSGSVSGSVWTQVAQVGAWSGWQIGRQAASGPAGIPVVAHPHLPPTPRPPRRGPGASPNPADLVPAPGTAPGVPTGGPLGSAPGPGPGGALPPGPSSPPGPLARPDPRESRWARWLRASTLDDLDVTLRWQPEQPPVAVLRQLRLDPAQAVAARNPGSLTPSASSIGVVQSLHFQGLDLLGEPVLSPATLKLRWQGPAVELLPADLPTTLGASLHCAGGGWVRGMQTSVLQLDAGWTGSLDSRAAPLQRLTQRLIREFSPSSPADAADSADSADSAVSPASPSPPAWQTGVDARARFILRGLQPQAAAQMHFTDGALEGELLLQSGSIDLITEGTQLRCPRGVFQLAASRGWLLTNGVLQSGGQSRGIVRFVSGTDFGLGWCDPRARAGHWIGGFQPLTDPGMWFRDVLFAGSPQAPVANLLSERELQPFFPQWSEFVAQLQAEGAPLGPLAPAVAPASLLTPVEAPVEAPAPTRPPQPD